MNPIFELIQAYNGNHGLEWSEDVKADFARSVAQDIMTRLEQEREYCANPSQYQNTEYYIKMDAKQSAFDDAISMIGSTYDICYTTTACWRQRRS